MGNKQGGKVTGKDGRGKTSQLAINNSNTLTKKDFKILTESTGMSKEEIKKVFDKFIVNNPDFLLDRAEFAKLYLQLRNEPVNNLDEITDFVFHAFDSDNNNMLTFNEFIAAYAFTSNGDQKAKLEYAFDLYDTDKNGFLNSAEVNGLVCEMLELMGAKSRRAYKIEFMEDEVMKAFDKNKDGKISKDEFVCSLANNNTLRALISPSK